jgi:hypothetical protein
MSRKTISPTIEFYQYIDLWYRYMRFVCSIKKISMLKAMEQFGYRFKTLYSRKVRFAGKQLQRS